jgi:hypothetical protein
MEIISVVDLKQETAVAIHSFVWPESHCGVLC